MAAMELGGIENGWFRGRKSKKREREIRVWRMLISTVLGIVGAITPRENRRRHTRSIQGSDSTV